jgi:mono/diheme cytochrome c family protein
LRVLAWPTRKSAAQAMRAMVAAPALLLAAMSTGYAAEGDAKRGQYLAQAGGCMACHTEDKPGAVAYAGGRALKTPFGTFYGPNITPDPQAGIGRWTQENFFRAMRHGERPDGANYFPAFPYPSFTRIADADLADLWAFLRTLPPSTRPTQQHDLHFPFGWRWPVTVWKLLFFSPGPLAPVSNATDAVNRGAYLVQALGHCGECHTPRNFLGGPKADRFLAGGKNPEGKRVPTLTPTRLGKWSDGELKEFLVTGLTADGDSADKTMEEVIRNTTSKLTPVDLAALMAYLRSVPPLPEEPREKP